VVHTSRAQPLSPTDWTAVSSSQNPSTTAVPALEQARTNYELALAYDPTSAGWPGLHFGRLLYLSGDLHAAEEAFRASIASGHVAYAPVASYHVGRLHEDLGNTETAIAAYRQASESVDPKQASAATYKLGCLLKAKGDIEAARTAFERAAAMTNTWYGHLADNALRTLVRSADTAPVRRPDGGAGHHVA
jgi:tetratricopeptide (TPR) repeat protein